MKELIPAETAQQSQGKEISELWLRISGFLDLKSENTQKTYLGIINEWCEFLGAEAGSSSAATLISTATDMHAVAYRNWLLKRPGQKPRYSTSASTTAHVAKAGKKYSSRADGLQSTLSNSTIAKKFAALRRIYRMLIAAELVTSVNPFDVDRVPPPAAKSGQKRPTEMLDFKLVKKVFEQPDLSTLKGLRDLCILQVLFGGGLRRSELINLRLGDVRKTSAGTAFLYLRATKAKKDAEHAIPGWVADNLKVLVERRKTVGAQAGDPVFVSFRGQAGRGETNLPMSASGVYRLFKRYCDLAGAGSFVSPHSARATAITRLLAQGVNHRDVQEFSRHASVQMVEVYDKRRLSVDQSPAKGLSY